MNCVYPEAPEGLDENTLGAKLRHPLFGMIYTKPFQLYQAVTFPKAKSPDDVSAHGTTSLQPRDANIEPVDSIRHAEALVFGAAGEQPISEYEVNAAAVNISRMTTRVAMLTRRGVGNTLMANRATAKYIMDNAWGIKTQNISLYLDSGAPQYDWFCTGSVINGSLNVWVGDHLPDDEVYVAYRGKLHADQPAYLYEDDGLHLCRISGGSDTHAAFRDYILKLNLRNLRQ